MQCITIAYCTFTKLQVQSILEECRVLRACVGLGHAQGGADGRQAQECMGVTRMCVRNRRCRS
jgi:hypothetical protein